MSKAKTRDLSLKPVQPNQQQIAVELSEQDRYKLNRMFNESAVQNYFVQAQSHMPLETLELAAGMYTEKGVRSITNDINQGQLSIPPAPHNINAYLGKANINVEQQRVLELRLKRDHIARTLEYLDAQTSRSPHASSARNPQLLGDFRPANVLTKEQHQSYVERLLKKRQQQDKRHKEIVQKLQLDIKAQEQKLKKVKLQSINKTKQTRRKAIQKSLERKRLQHQRFLQEQKRSNQQFEAIQRKQFLHQKWESKYQSQVEIPLLAEKKKRLKQMRQLSKAFNVNELLIHERQYLQKRNQSFSTVKSNVDDSWHYKPPKKTQKLSHLLEEQKTNKKKILENHKRVIDEKIARQENFVTYLKDKFTPRVSSAKKLELESMIERSTTKRREATLDPKVIGISYLEQAKKMKKKAASRPETQKYSQNSKQNSKRGYTNYLLSNNPRGQDYYEQKRRQRIDKLVNSEEQSGTKIKRLKREAQKINEVLQRKYKLRKHKESSEMLEQDSIQLLLSGIQAKMGIINVYKKQNQ